MEEERKKPTLSRGSIVELTIDAAAFEGGSIARHDGLVVFVEGGVPGDRVRAQVHRARRKHVEAHVLEILSPSPNRVKPPCAHFGVCGGCRWQHVGYAAQLAFKEQHVRDSLERIGGMRDAAVLPIIGSGDIYFYRNKLEYSFGDRRWRTAEEMASGRPDEAAFVLGFHAPDRYDRIIPITECHLQSPLSNMILRAVGERARQQNLPVYSVDRQEGYLRNLVIREGKNTGDVMVNLVTFDDRPDIVRGLAAELNRKFTEITTIVNNITSRRSQVAVGDEEKVLYGEGFIRETLGSIVFRISSNSFFQTNTRQAERLYRVAREFGRLQASDVVYDLYCGTGAISLFIARAVKQVVGIDIVQGSIADAQLNARQNGISNASFVTGDLKDLLTKDREWSSSLPPPDVLIVDPPRSGMHPDAVNALGEMHIPRLVYVSCNPATLARDLKMLVPFGYRVDRVQPVDMFPHTYHIESVVQLSATSA